MLIPGNPPYSFILYPDGQEKIEIYGQDFPSDFMKAMNAWLRLNSLVKQVVVLFLKYLIEEFGL
ncbi:MAG: hypothetical protein HC880_11285 [Bacteroidia bacterium]|nr:hypothetical protein [Bacteroidia bacterium]